MSDVKPIWQEVKVEEGGPHPLAEACMDTTGIPQQNKDFSQDPLLKQPSEIQHHHPWMMNIGVPSPFYYPYCAPPDSYYPYSFSEIEKMYESAKQGSDDFLAMLNTADVETLLLSNQMRFKNYLSRYTFLHPLQPLPSLQQPQFMAMEKLEEESQPKYRGRLWRSRIRNETKNIPKNYGKAMISFIMERSDWIKLIYGSEIHNQLISELKARKNRINSIAHLKQLWTTSKYATEFRVLSNLFLRKYSFAYIFNSRVSNYTTHIKYKYKLQEALKNPATFKNIKEY